MTELGCVYIISHTLDISLANVSRYLQIMEVQSLTSHVHCDTVLCSQCLYDVQICDQLPWDHGRPFLSLWFWLQLDPHSRCASAHQRRPHPGGVSSHLYPGYVHRVTLQSADISRSS